MVNRRHHSNLNMEFDENLQSAKEISKNILKNIDEIYIDYKKVLDDQIMLTKEEFKDVVAIDENRVKNFNTIPSYFTSGRSEKRGVEPYFLLIYFFSMLIDYDKIDSAEVKLFENNILDITKLEEFIERKPYNEKRNMARNEILSVLKALKKDELNNIGIFLLPGPTGIGKTLASLNGAIYLQNALYENWGMKPKIITAIPFINIIQQTEKDYKDIFDNEKIIVHHRLADFTISSNDISDKDPIDKLLLETESWNGDIVLTTFVQLFHSIITSRNRALKKFNKLADSIIILDEIQAVPEKYMAIIGAVIIKMWQHFGTRFILMSATHPKIIELGKKLLQEKEGKANSKEILLLNDYKKYFFDLTRTQIIPILKSKLDVESFTELFFKKFIKKESAVVVVNTIKKSIDIYTKIKNKIEEKKFNTHVYNLSTNIIPKERKEVIRKVKGHLDKGESVILISTQTIEAGVDLDFHMGFRALSPIASIIQTAGRINREGKKKNYCPLYLIEFEKDCIYDLSTIEDTREFFKDKDSILECEYIKIVEEYYNKVFNKGIPSATKEIYSAMMRLKFDEIDSFTLIDKVNEIIDVFVEYDMYAIELKEIYIKMLMKEKIEDSKIKNAKLNGYKDNMNDYERNAFLKLVEAKMNDYIIQVRKTKDTRLEKFEDVYNVKSQLYYIENKHLDKYYDKYTGYISESGATYMY